jgi:hypothetical protein
MKFIFLGLVTACLAQSVAAQEQSAAEFAELVLERMPCRAWSAMYFNPLSKDDGRIALETWTVRFVRGYAKQVVAQLKKHDPQTPESELKNAEGADVDDRRVVEWIMHYCVGRPDSPFPMAVLFLTSSFRIFPDRQLPLPPSNKQP